MPSSSKRPPKPKPYDKGKGKDNNPKDNNKDGKDGKDGHHQADHTKDTNKDKRLVVTDTADAIKATGTQALGLRIDNRPVRSLDATPVPRAPVTRAPGARVAPTNTPDNKDATSNDVPRAAGAAGPLFISTTLANPITDAIEGRTMPRTPSGSTTTFAAAASMATDPSAAHFVTSNLPVSALLAPATAASPTAPPTASGSWAALVITGKLPISALLSPAPTTVAATGPVTAPVTAPAAVPSSGASAASPATSNHSHHNTADVPDAYKYDKDTISDSTQTQGPTPPPELGATLAPAPAISATLASATAISNTATIITTHTPSVAPTITGTAPVLPQPVFNSVSFEFVDPHIPIAITTAGTANTPATAATAASTAPAAIRTAPINVAALAPSTVAATATTATATSSTTSTATATAPLITGTHPSPPRIAITDALIDETDSNGILHINNPEEPAANTLATPPASPCPLTTTAYQVLPKSPKSDNKRPRSVSPATASKRTKAAQQAALGIGAPSAPASLHPQRRASSRHAPLIGSDSEGSHSGPTTPTPAPKMNIGKPATPKRKAPASPRKRAVKGVLKTPLSKIIKPKSTKKVRIVFQPQNCSARPANGRIAEATVPSTPAEPSTQRNGTSCSGFYNAQTSILGQEAAAAPANSTATGSSAAPASAATTAATGTPPVHPGQGEYVRPSTPADPHPPRWNAVDGEPNQRREQIPAASSLSRPLVPSPLLFPPADVPPGLRYTTVFALDINQRRVYWHAVSSLYVNGPAQRTPVEYLRDDGQRNTFQGGGVPVFRHTHDPEATAAERRLEEARYRANAAFLASHDLSPVAAADVARDLPPPRYQMAYSQGNAPAAVLIAPRPEPAPHMLGPEGEAAHRAAQLDPRQALHNHVALEAVNLAGSEGGGGQTPAVERNPHVQQGHPEAARQPVSVHDVDALRPPADEAFAYPPEVEAQVSQVQSGLEVASYRDEFEEFQAVRRGAD